MKIDICNGTTKQFAIKRIEIITLYNRLSNLLIPESTSAGQIPLPERIYAVSVAGIEGGLIVNLMGSDLDLATIQFAAFPEEHQGKGYLKACLTKVRKFLSKRGYKLVSVELNPNDSTEVWQHLGFTHSGMVNYVQHLFNEPTDTLFPKETQRAGGEINPDDFYAIFGQYLK